MDTHVDHAVAELAARQHGAVSHAQLVALGLGRSAITYRIGTGRLHPIHRGVYAVGHPLLSQHGRWCAAVLACGPGAALGHRSAAALWELRAAHAGGIDVVIPSRSGRRHAGVVVHRSPGLRQEDVTLVEGVATTTVARTLLDLATVISRRDLERMIDEAEVQRRLDLAEIDDVIAAHGAMPGRARLATLRATHRPGTTLTRSALEERFLALCDRAGIERPELNVRVGPYEVDALWRAQHLAVELDGHAFHGTRAAFERDRARDADLVARGLRVVRFTHRQVVEDGDAASRTLRRLLRA